MANEKSICIPAILSNPLRKIHGYETYGTDYMGNIHHEVNDRLKMLRPFMNDDYSAVKLDGSICSVARIVASLYVTNTDPTRTKVFHINGEITDNAASNLVWVTPSEMNELSLMPIEERVDYLKHRDQQEFDLSVTMD